MLAILPLIGGFTVGRFAPQRLAIVLQAIFYVLAAVVIIATRTQPRR